MRKQGIELDKELHEVDTRLASAGRLCDFANRRCVSPALPSGNPTLDSIRGQNTKLVEALTKERDRITALLNSEIRR